MKRALGRRKRGEDCLFMRFNAILTSVFWSNRVKIGDGKCSERKRNMPEQTYTIETEQEDDGRWIAEIIDLAGVLAYGMSEQEAIANAEAIAFRVIADRIEETKIGTSSVSFASA